MSISVYDFLGESWLNWELLLSLWSVKAQCLIFILKTHFIRLLHVLGNRQFPLGLFKIFRVINTLGRLYALYIFVFCCKAFRNRTCIKIADRNPLIYKIDVILNQILIFSFWNKNKVFCCFIIWMLDLGFLQGLLELCNCHLVLDFLFFKVPYVILKHIHLILWDVLHHILVDQNLEIIDESRLMLQLLVTLYLQIVNQLI